MSLNKLDLSFGTAIAVAAYSYMSLVPTHSAADYETADHQRGTPGAHALQPGSGFPCGAGFIPDLVTVIVSLIAPVASPLIATMMFGNLMREVRCGGST